MKKKITQKTEPTDKNISELIKSLGGAKSIHSYLLSKNKDITIDSIYKWKTNGIPYRYQLEIKELSDNNNILLPIDSFSNNQDIKNRKAEIFSNSDNQGNTRSVKNNIFLYLLIIISALILIYIIYSLNNINDLKKKILIIEKSLSTISSLNYDEKINSFTKINKAQNEIINKNTLKINEITAINDNINDIINNIELDKSRIDLKQPTNTSSVRISYNFILLYLMDIKSDIKASTPNLSKIAFINNYFDKVSIPKEIELALKNLLKLNNIELKGHIKIIDQIDAVFININKPVNKNNDIKKTLINKLKTLIKVTKTNNYTFINIKNSHSKIIETIKNNNYNQSLYELNLINKNGEFDNSIQDIQNLESLYESIDLIIKWLIFKG